MVAVVFALTHGGVSPAHSRDALPCFACAQGAARCSKTRSGAVAAW